MPTGALGGCCVVRGVGHGGTNNSRNRGPTPQRRGASGTDQIPDATAGNQGSGRGRAFGRVNSTMRFQRRRRRAVRGGGAAGRKRSVGHAALESGRTPTAGARNTCRV